GYNSFTKLLNSKKRMITIPKKNKTRRTTGKILASLFRVLSKQFLQNVYGISIAGGINIVRS
ncbi:MAG: hypothetical protein ACFFAU_04400, partial [Candidatus Hodarchaeota archaeon]